MSYTPGPLPGLGDACRAILHRQGICPFTRMDTTQTLFALARAAAPGATVQAYVLIEGGGNVCETRLCKVKLTAPDVLAPVFSQGDTPEKATEGLKKKWAAARRAFDVERVLRECDRLAGGSLDPDHRTRMGIELESCGLATFDAMAGRCRKAAQTYAAHAA